MKSNDFIVEKISDTIIVYDTRYPYNDKKTKIYQRSIAPNLDSKDKAIAAKEELKLKQKYKKDTNQLNLSDEVIQIRSTANRGLQAIDQSKPTNFSAVNDISQETFRAPKLIAHLKTDTEYKETYNYNFDPDLSAAENITSAKKIFKDFYQQKYNKRVNLSDIEVTSYNPQPKRKNNKELDSNNLLSTTRQNIKNYVSQNINQHTLIRNLATTNKVITLNNIKRLINQSKTGSYSKQNSTYNDLLSHFIDNPNKKTFPLTIISDLNKLKSKQNFYTQSSLAADFGEVLSPVALLTNNLNGNANRVVLNFLKAKSYDEVIQRATIHYNPNSNDPLVDSYVEYNGNIIGISSKAQGGSGASTKGLLSAINDIKQNPAVLKLFNKEILGNNRYNKAYKVLELMANDTDSSWQTKFNVLLLTRPDTITKNDINLITQSYTSDKVTRNNNINKLMSGRNGFSNELKSMMQQFTASTSAGERNGIWFQLLKAAKYYITTTMNSDPVYSELCVWIFNHGAIIQVDLQHNQTNVPDLKEVKTSNTVPFTIINMIGTWPSNRVEFVEFVEEGAGDGLSIRLHTGKYAQQFSNLAKNKTPPTLTQPTVKNNVDDTRSLNDKVKFQSDWYTTDNNGQYKSNAMQSSNDISGYTDTHSLTLNDYKAIELAGQGVTNDQLNSLISRGMSNSAITIIQSARNKLFTMLNSQEKINNEKVKYDDRQLEKSQKTEKNIGNVVKADVIYPAIVNLLNIKKTNPTLFNQLSTEAKTIAR